MGEDVAEIFYGFEIEKELGSDLAERLPDYCGKDKELGEFFKTQGCYLNHPNENDEYYIMVKKSKEEVNNGGVFLGKIIEKKDEWDESLRSVAEKFELVFDDLDVGWYLVGHYE